VKYTETVASYEDKVERLSLEKEVMASALDDLRRANNDEYQIELEQSSKINSLVGEIQDLKILIDGMQV
jgi:hypothetical protein